MEQAVWNYRAKSWPPSNDHLLKLLEHYLMDTEFRAPPVPYADSSRGLQPEAEHSVLSGDLWCSDRCDRDCPTQRHWIREDLTMSLTQEASMLVKHKRIPKPVRGWQ